ncbi:DUF2637 domain-containing protein [Streptomyces triculaminicus]|uniref:DUF2637 domain-containing protein n=1 Tax=Streptomyces triculaminicus TaxID=2816232 RepID=UPI0037A40762
MNPKARRTAMIVVSCAAIATTGWSLCAVTGHYGTPRLIALVAVAAFDGIAYLALHLASEASAEGRSAFGARLTAAVMAAISVALNIKHADLIDGGTIAALAFSSPSVGLLAVSELSWAGPRAVKRAERGERPFRPASLGGWSWLMAPIQAGQSVREQALQHIDNSSKTTPPAAVPVQDSATETPAVVPVQRSATEKLRGKFAKMDPAEVIKIAHESQPELTPAELAALLVHYGVIVDAVQVALVLHGETGHVTTIDRADTPRDAPVVQHDAPQVGALPPVSKTKAILDAASLLGPQARAADIAKQAENFSCLPVDPAYVRTVLSREARRVRAHAEQRPRQLEIDSANEGGGFYP